MNADPFDENVMQELWALDREHPEKSMNANEILFWETSVRKLPFYKMPG